MDNESNPIFNPKTGTKTTPGALTESDFRELIARILKQCPKDRQSVAVELSTLTGERITERMLNDWVASSKGKVRFPASFVRTFCEVTADDRPARAVLPDHLKRALAIGERVSQCPALLREALTVMEKLAKDQRTKKR